MRGPIPMEPSLSAEPPPVIVLLLILFAAMVALLVAGLLFLLSEVRLSTRQMREGMEVVLEDTAAADSGRQR